MGLESWCSEKRGPHFAEGSEAGRTLSQYLIEPWGPVMLELGLRGATLQGTGEEGELIIPSG